MENEIFKKKLLQKIQKNQLPIFYFNPIFPETIKDPSVLRIKEFKVTNYETDRYQIPDLKITRPICKSFKI